MPALPVKGNTDWRDDWAQAVHNAAKEVADGRLAVDAVFKVATDHGVKRDGVTDTGAAIVAAATALSNAGGGVLFFPAGQYRFNTMLLDGVSNVEFRGVGSGTHFQTTYSHTASVAAIKWRGDNIAFRGIKLEAMNKIGSPQAGFGEYELLRIGGTVAQFRKGVRVEDCEFIDGGGVNVYCTENVVIRGNKYRDSHGNSFGAVNCIQDVLIDGNYAYNGNDDLIAVTCDSTAAVAGGSRRVAVVNNILDTTDAKAICFSGVDGGVIANNNCRYTFAMGIVAFQDSVFGLQPSNRIVIANNVVREAGKCFGPGRLHADTISGVANGIMIDNTAGVVNCQIIGNQILNTQDRGIQVNRGVQVVIADNIIVGAGGVGINVGNPGATDFTTCSRVGVRGNIIRQTTGGMSLGSITGVVVSDNQISSYLNGANPARRGIFYAYLKYGHISNNVIINDDGGQETILQFPVSSVGITTSGNVEIANPA